MSFMINDLVITAPEEWTWSPQVMGVSHMNLQVRSPYYTLQMRRRVVGGRFPDWLAYDNTELDSLTVPSHDGSEFVSRYLEAVCTSVEITYREGIPTGVSATFNVNTESR